MLKIGDPGFDEIENSRMLTELFGYWPSFHDAEVRSLRMDSRDGGGPVLEATLYVFQMTPEVDSRGYYILRHESLVTIRFANIAGLELAGFNSQNVLMSLHLALADSQHDDSRRWEVSFVDSYGLSAKFACGSIAVLNLEPLTED
jgi:hypothetical protein